METLGNRTSNLIAAGIALALGAYALSQTGEMSELGAVFPTTAAIVLIIAALALALRVVLRGGKAAEQQSVWSGLEWPRLVGLSITLLAWALLLKPLGFMPAAALGLLAVGVITYRERMGLKALALHLLAGGALLAGFYGLFSVVLRVPLP
ncbi:hypothetical protein HBA54_05160 [Pelagibius litoralis]|uniref:DUF1468 domain-containing protein n=1 Tax=Pelagibius litoralis TaxID=374515 RepID=A0A967C3N6_9PROT|nr:tripartite tricarboxylate transporter TctB family protein [Pelagibius litoralis]NIA67975.1 hypothetical protein [Pelagibius litoralis]